MRVEGNIISGEFDEQKNEFALQKVKHFTTESILKEYQLNDLYDYLIIHKLEADGQVLTLYDQMPVLLNQKEIHEFIDDLKKIRSFYHY